MINWIKSDYGNTCKLTVGKEYLVYGFQEDDGDLYYSTKISKWGRETEHKVSESKGLITYKKEISPEFENEYYFHVSHFAHINTPLPE